MTDLTDRAGATTLPGAASFLTLADLASRGAAPAVVVGGRTVSYAALADRVHERVGLLGPRRRLVLVGACNALDPLVTYLAALVGDHVVLLAPGCDAAAHQRRSLQAAWAPDVVHVGGELTQLRAGTGHHLHPELAVLLSTSGSTGSPKLVRLSTANLRSNAAAIVAYLGLTASDRAVTSLPFHYCYGLSVINSHLLAGASLLMSQRSVVEDEFWDDFEAFGATSFAGVPYTFELLAASGFAHRVPPSLRQITQAGGRLAPEQVRRFAELGRTSGFDLVVMYGQTEATARMAYLPPRLAVEHPGTIGVPIPGGRFRIDPIADRDDAGELVYTGDNVMLGYAERPADLALGRTVTELRTGDLARRHADGLFEIVGRLSRFAKVYGLRIDLDRIEAELARQGLAARVVAHDDRLSIFVRARSEKMTARCRAATFAGIPEHAIDVHRLAVFPTTASGKPDRAALERHAARKDAARARPRSASATAIRDMYAELLARPDATTEDSFVSLRGDSLSYVEVSVWLAQMCGSLPGDWATRTCAQLAASDTPRRRRCGGVRVETALVWRAVAIVLIVGTHADLFNIQGGAHLLLVLVGFNLARFQLAAAPRRDRVGSLLRAAAHVLVPSALWIGAVGLLTGAYRPATALMLNQVVGSER